MSTIKKLRAEIAELDSLRKHGEKAMKLFNFITIEQSRRMRRMAQEIAQLSKQPVEKILKKYEVKGSG